MEHFFIKFVVYEIEFQISNCFQFQFWHQKINIDWRFFFSKAQTNWISIFTLVLAKIEPHLISISKQIISSSSNYQLFLTIISL